MDRYQDLFYKIAQKENVEIKSMKRINADLIEVVLGYTNSLEHVDLETCSKCAFAFAEAIDYEIGLDVVSEGAEQVIPEPLYQEALGKYVHVKYKQPKSGYDKLEGTLLEVNDELIILKTRFKHSFKNIEVERSNIDLLRFAVLV